MLSFWSRVQSRSSELSVRSYETVQILRIIFLRSAISKALPNCVRADYSICTTFNQRILNGLSKTKTGYASYDTIGTLGTCMNMNITFYMKKKKNEKNFSTDNFHSFSLAKCFALCELFLLVRNNGRITIVITSLTCVKQLLNRSLISVNSRNECLTCVPEW